MYKNLNLRPEEFDRLTQLVESSGMNRNQFFKMLINTLTEDDVDALIRRSA